MADFMDRVRIFGVPSRAVALWMLEQNHFVLKTPGGVIAHIDPFVSRVVHPENHIYPSPLVEPEDLRGDWALLTHDHRDHTDPETIGPMASANPRCRFVGTPESAAQCRACGVGPERFIEVAEGQTLSVGPFALRVVHGENTSPEDATTHLGFIIDTEDVCLYNVGDTRFNVADYAARMTPVAGLRPDGMMVPVNTGYNNPGPAGALQLVALADPRMVIPCHFNCFRHNRIDPAEFLKVLPPERRATARVLARGEGLMIRAGGDATPIGATAI